MSAAEAYALDANVFIGAKQAYYSFEICPGFWLALVRLHEARRVFSIDRVKAELIGADDQLKHWVQKTAPDTFFKGTADRQVIDVYGEMMNWVQNQPQFMPEAKEEFASVADGWLVAYAKVNGLVVVTHEFVRARRHAKGANSQCLP